MARANRLSHASGGALRGQTWQVEEMIKLFLVILIFGGAVLLVMGATGGLTNVLNEFCEKNPEWCGAVPTDDDYVTATESTNALICAINSITTGNLWSSSRCSYSSSSQDSSDDSQGSVVRMPIVTSDGTGNIASRDYSDFMTGFQTAVISSDAVKELETVCVPVDAEHPEWSTCCKMGTGESGEYVYLWISSDDQCMSYGGEVSADNMCSQELECTIYNFQLPQDIGDAEEWIEGFGDPRFITYYMQFPAGEEAAWSGWSEWFKGSDTLIFAAACLSQIAFYSGYAVARPVNSVVRVAELPVEAFRGIKKLSSIAKKAFSEFKYIGDDLVQSRSRKELLQNLYIYSEIAIEETTKKSFNTFKKIAPGTAGYTGIAAGAATVASYADARFHTEFGKYIPNEGTMILQEAVNKEPIFEEKPILSIQEVSGYSDPINENIVDLIMPILLKKTGEEEYRPFYLASPCEADLVVSKKHGLRCEEYMYDSIAEKVYCDSPEEQNWLSQIKPCGSVGSLFTGFSEDFSSEIAELVTVGMQKEVIFQDADNDGKKDVATEPLLGFTFEVETNPANIACCEYDDLSADKYYNWLDRDFCTSKGGAIVADSICEAEVKGTSVTTKPPAVVKSIYHTNLGDEEIVPNYKGNAFPFSCVKVKTVLDDSDQRAGKGSHGDILMFGEGVDIVACYMPLHEYKDHEDLESVLTRSGALYESEIDYNGIELIFDVDNNGEINDLMHILIGARENALTASLGRDYVLLSDKNLDGKLDSISTHYLLSSDISGGLTGTVPTRIFTDSDFDGQVDMVSSTRCEIDAVTIEPVIGDHSTENNFCYSSEREWVGLATIVAGFAIDVTVKKIPTPATWLLGTAIDCVLAYKTADWSTPDWPSNDWG